MKQYHDLLKHILENGTYKKPARLNMPGTRSIFGYQFRHDLKTFPLLTTKKMFWKGVVVELLWFLKGDTNVKYLIDNGVNFWNQDAYNFYVKKFLNNDTNLQLSFDDFVDHLKTNTPVHNTDEYVFGDCGFQYGRVWRNFNGKDQITSVITSLKRDPNSRRHIVSAVDPEHDNELALYWCHSMYQFNCRQIPYPTRFDMIEEYGYNFERIHEVSFNGNVDELYKMMDPDKADQIMKLYKEPIVSEQEIMDILEIPKYYLDCQLYQRSGDVFLGVPMNIASYALLTNLVAKLCNMVPGDYIHTFGDVHIYDNHTEAVNIQLQNDCERYPLPTVEINLPEYDTLDGLFKTMTPEMFVLKNYQSYPAIKAELSTGLVLK